MIRPAFFHLIWHRAIFPEACAPSIVAAAPFHCRVRNGNGWDRRAIDTRNRHAQCRHPPRGAATLRETIRSEASTLAATKKVSLNNPLSESEANTSSSQTTQTTIERYKETTVTHRTYPSEPVSFLERTPSPTKQQRRRAEGGDRRSRHDLPYRYLSPAKEKRHFPSAEQQHRNSDPKVSYLPYHHVRFILFSQALGRLEPVC